MKNSLELSTINRKGCYRSFFHHSCTYCVGARAPAIAMKGWCLLQLRWCGVEMLFKCSIIAERYINPHTNSGFKPLFGSEFNKELLISFLNAIFHGEQNVQDVTYLNSEQLGERADARRAIFDVYCENDKGEKFIVEMLFTRLFEQAEISKFDKEELNLYEDSVNAYRDIVNAIRTAEKKKFAEGMAEGIAEGMAKGEKAAKVKIAANLLSFGVPMKTIMQASGLMLKKK